MWLNRPVPAYITHSNESGPANGLLIAVRVPSLPCGLSGVSGRHEGSFTTAQYWPEISTPGRIDGVRVSLESGEERRGEGTGRTKLSVCHGDYLSA